MEIFIYDSSWLWYKWSEGSGEKYAERWIILSENMVEKVDLSEMAEKYVLHLSDSEPSENLHSKTRQNEWSEWKFHFTSLR